MTNRPLCIYHGNCFDGFAAAWAVRKAFSGEVDFHAGAYQTPPPDVAGRDVIMVDFSYKRPVLDSMLWSGDGRQANTILILDHHKTAAKDLREITRPEWMHGGGPMGTYAPRHWRRQWESWGLWPERAVFDMERSGAGLAWDFFHPGKGRPYLIDHIEDRDLWRFKIAGTHLVHAALSAHEFDFDLWDRLIDSFESAAFRQTFIAEGDAIERKHRRDVQSLLAVVRREMTIGGHRVPVANMPITMTSDAGNAMAAPGSFAACYWDTPEGRVFSLRSRDDGLDVSEIAKAYGGGGHRNAAGFRMPIGWEGDKP